MREGLTVAVRAELLHIGDRGVAIRHPEKILFPEDGISKQELIDYYRRIAP